MPKRTSIASAVAAAALTVVLVGVAVNGFTDAEKKVIRQIKQRMTTIEATHAADVSSLQADIRELQNSIDGLVGDMSVLNENQVILSNDIDILDAGLSGIVAEDGPLAQIDRNLLMTQEIVFANHPPIALTDIEPLVSCDGTSCTIDVEWNSAPPSSGQVEWGNTPEYGNLTTKQVEPLAYHKQRVGTFPQDDTTYHFRVLGELPDGSSASSETVMVSATS